MNRTSRSASSAPARPGWQPPGISPPPGIRSPSTKRPRSVGGLAAGFKDEAWDWTLEKFYHHWFASDHDIFALADEMGVRDRIIFPRPKTSYWLDGAPLRSEISPSALFLPLSLTHRLRAWRWLACYLKLTPSWQLPRARHRR